MNEKPMDHEELEAALTSLEANPGVGAAMEVYRKAAEVSGQQYPGPMVVSASGTDHRAGQVVARDGHLGSAAPGDRSR